jgi:hypothetical protein
MLRDGMSGIREIRRRFPTRFATISQFGAHAADLPGVPDADEVPLA